MHAVPAAVSEAKGQRVTSGSTPFGRGPAPCSPAQDLESARILIVDDELPTRRSLAAILARQGWTVLEASSGRQALDLLGRYSFDLVLLDIKMPEMDGTEVLRRGKKLARSTMFVFITAFATVETAVAGLRGGAFDYLTKPSPVDEIIRTVRAGLTERTRRAMEDQPLSLLERAAASLRAADHRPCEDSVPERFLSGQGLQVDTFKRLVTLNGQIVGLTATEHELLASLLRHRDRILSCSELVLLLRGLKLHEADARVFLRSHIRRLRTKLASAGGHNLVVSVRGRGYTFAALETG